MWDLLIIKRHTRHQLSQPGTPVSILTTDIVFTASLDIDKANYCGWQSALLQETMPDQCSSSLLEQAIN